MPKTLKCWHPIVSLLLVTEFTKHVSSCDISAHKISMYCNTSQGNIQPQMNCNAKECCKRVQCELNSYLSISKDFFNESVRSCNKLAADQALHCNLTQSNQLVHHTWTEIPGHTGTMFQPSPSNDHLQIPGLY